MASVPQQEAMEDILSSIRTTMAEETAKVGSGSTDLIEAAAKQDGEEDVLELSSAEMVPDSGQPAAEEGLIDLQAFASKGESKPADPATIPQAYEELTAPPQVTAEAETPAAAAEGQSTPEEAADEFDRLLAEISQEQENQVAAVEEQKQALLAEEEPLGAPVVPQAQPMAAVAERMVAQELQTGAVIPATVTYAPDAAPGALPQVAFPADVLALALRPMVQEWLTANLPGVVERLVKAEIDKLSQS